jgi:hypothetical protein
MRIRVNGDAHPFKLALSSVSVAYCFQFLVGLHAVSQIPVSGFLQI